MVISPFAAIDPLGLYGGPSAWPQLAGYGLIGLGAIIDAAGVLGAPETGGTSLLAEGEGTSLIAEGETFFQTMSQADFQSLSANGSLSATSETFISPSLEYASQYEGVTVQLTGNSGTTEGLLGIGGRNAGLAWAPYSDLPLVQSGWTAGNAFFKFEGCLVNIGLGRGSALDLFNANLIEFSVVH